MLKLMERAPALESDGAQPVPTGFRLEVVETGGGAVGLRFARPKLLRWWVVAGLVEVGALRWGLRTRVGVGRGTARPYRLLVGGDLDRWYAAGLLLPKRHAAEWRMLKLMERAPALESDGAQPVPTDCWLGAIWTGGMRQGSWSPSAALLSGGC